MANQAKKAAKGTTNKGARRLMRSVRRTLGTLFLISALIIAAIPVDYLRAADGDSAGSAGIDRPNTARKDMKVSIAPHSATDISAGVPAGVPTGWTQSEIPDVKPGGEFGSRIYKSGNRVFDFVVSKITNDSLRYAVIIGYDNMAQSETGSSTLTIPKTMDVYADYNGQSCAIGGLDGELLFYKQEVPIENGTATKYLPCLYNTIDTWGQYDFDKGTGTSNLYYIKGLTKYGQKEGTIQKDSDSASAQDLFRWEDGIIVSDKPDQIWRNVNTNLVERIKAIKVYFIGNQNAKKATSVDRIVNITKDEDGIFYGATVGNIEIEPNLKGIGNYAFAGVTHINKVSLSETIKEIGNYAFSGCTGITEFKIDGHASNVVIGDHAFYGCQNLDNFDAGNVKAIGDSAFENCLNLKNINFLTTGYAGSLQRLGYYAFADCANLEKIIFPNTYAESDILVSTFERCKNLQYIYAPGDTTSVNFVGDTYFSLEEFRQQGGGDWDKEEDKDKVGFYFEGPVGRPLETTAIENGFVYKTAELNVYRRKKNYAGGNSAIFKAAAIGDSKTGAITDVAMTGVITSLKIEWRIGPLTIVEIAERSIKDKCGLYDVTIPTTIERIKTDAFKGSHDLKNVIFENNNGAMNLTEIADGAFKTQDAICSHVSTLPKVPELNFVGPISKESEPFRYAMEPKNSINNGSQTSGTYLTYHSGWPSNLVVRYIPDLGSTLIEYPTFANLLNGTYYQNKTYLQYSMANYETVMREAATEGMTHPFPPASGVTDPLEGNKRRTVDAVMNIELPAGIQAVKPGLFAESEKYETSTIANTAGANPQNIRKSLRSRLENIASEAFKGAVYLGSVKLEGDLKAIGSYAFKDCENLSAVDMADAKSLESIGEYAFQDCASLVSVSLPSTLPPKGIVKAPFIGCEKLTDVNFNGNPNYVCDTSILYGTEGGTKTALIEYLDGRSSTDPDVTATETGGITEIYPDAFRNTGVQFVNLSDAQFKILKEAAFRGTSRMVDLILPSTCVTIQKDAFSDSTFKRLTVPNSDARLDMSMFQKWTADNTNSENMDLTGKILYNPELNKETVWAFWTEKGGKALPVGTDYKVTYLGRDADGVYSITIDEKRRKPEERILGDAPTDKAVKEKAPYLEGWSFAGWDCNGDGKTDEKDTEMLMPSKDVEVRAIYEQEVQPAFYTVKFLDRNNESLYTERVIPSDPKIQRTPDKDANGSTITMWLCVNDRKSYTPEGVKGIEITENMDFMVVATADGPSGTSSPSGSPGPSGTPGPSSSPGPSGTPGPSGSPGPSGTPGPSGSPAPTAAPQYSLVVQGGSGTGSYTPGAQVIISAGAAPRGQVFSGWTVSPAATVTTDKTLSAMIITMPDNDVGVIANYKASTGGTDSSGGSGSSGGVTSGVISNGTTVVIDKNGLSNTGVVAVTVRGSSDNFTIKVTENSSATEAVLKALQTEYGSLDSVKYFPMDISLYDATGTKKITDTTGLSISVTLPLPDSLIAYAGNNKVAGVLNDRLDKLTPKFTTINGVSCVTFTAEHFSPYVIYVDVRTLSGSGGSADSTPKTADGIHPKWFLSIGLASLSFVMFMMKEGGAKPKKKQKVAVKAYRKNI